MELLDVLLVIISALVGGVIGWLIQERRLGHQDTQAEKSREWELETRQRNNLRDAISTFRQKVKDGYFLVGHNVFYDSDFIYLYSLTPDEAKEQLNQLWGKYKYLVNRQDVPSKFGQIDQAKEDLILFLGSMQNQYA